MRSGSKDDIPSVATNVQLQNSVDTSSMLHSPESPNKLASGQKNSKKKKHKTYVETAYGAGNSEDDATSEVEEQHRKSKNTSVGSLDSDQSSQHPIDQRSESGIKAVVECILTTVFFYGL